MKTVTDKKLKAYFLGSLAAAEAERLEEELAASAELTEQAIVVETELADEYLRGNFAAAERRLFETNYLTTEARREKLRLAENLWKVAAEENQLTAATPASAFWQTLFANRGRLAFGGLAAAIIFGGLIFLRLNSNKNPEIAKQENANQPLNVSVKNQNNAAAQNINADNQNLNVNTNSANDNRQKNENVNSPKSNHAPETKPTPKQIEQIAPTLATFVLSPGNLRSEGEQFIKISPNTSKVNLQLTLPKDAVKYQIYRAVLQTADGETVSTSSRLKSLNLILSVEKLENRTYLIFLEGQNSPGQPAEAVTEYTFRVRR